MRTALNTQLKLIFTATGADGEPVESNVVFKNATNGAEETKIQATANALASLYENNMTDVHEIVENKIA